MKRFLLLLCAAAAVIAAAPAAGQEPGRIFIDRTAGKKANPTLVFRGVAGNPAMSERVFSNLRYCGWFDVRSGGTSDYVVSGNAAGNAVTLSLFNGANRKIADVSASEGSLEKSAATVVDAILKHEFGIPGICRSKIVFSTEIKPGVRDIYMCDFDGRNLKRITDNRTLSVEPAWAPDGKSIVYSFYGQTFTNLIQYRFDIGKSRRLTGYRGINAGGSISPDGKYVALILSRDRHIDLYIRSVEGGPLIRLTNDSAVEASPEWTPDGRGICYVSDSAGRPLLYMVDPFRRTPPVRIAGIRGSERVTPDFASDGTLAYSAKVGGDYVLTVAEMNGTQASMTKIGLPDTPDIPGEGPSWAPDNRHVVMAFKGVLFVVDTRLGTQRRLLKGPSRTFQPDWSPILP